MTVLTSEEQNTAENIINYGLQQAAEALSFFIKQPVSVGHLHLSDLQLTDQVPLPDQDDNHLLVTELVGDIEGFCCLIFSAEEAQLLQQAALPPEVLANEAMAKTMGEAILLEVDNIIAAAVITQLANLLQRQLHGAVPELQILSASGLEDFLQQRLQERVHVLNFRANFKTADGGFSPAFLWFVQEPMLSAIRQLTTEKPS